MEVSSVGVRSVARQCAYSLVIVVGSSEGAGNLSVSLLDEGLSETLTLWKSDESLLSFSNAEDVRETGGEGVSISVLDVDDLVGTWVVLDVHELANTTNVVSSHDEDVGTVLKLDDFVDFASLEVEL